MQRVCRNVLLYFCCLLAMPVAAVAQIEGQSTSKKDLAILDGKQVRQEVGDWGVDCTQKAGEAPRCRMVQYAMSAKTQKAVLTWLLGRDGEGNQVMSFQTPGGLLLPEGIRVALDDGAPMVVPFRTCVRDICEAVAPLSESLVRAMQSGRKAAITLTNLDGKPATITMSLKGFTGAYKIFSGNP